MAWKSAQRGATERRDPILEFSQRIVEQFELGVKPWDSLKCAGPSSPFNPVTQHVYRGINVLILGMDITAFETGDPRFRTYKQAQEKGWQVKAGAKARTIFYTKSYDVKDDDVEDGTKSIHFLKHFYAFPAADINGIPPYVSPTTEEAPWQSDQAASITMRIGGDRAFYCPASDHIQAPPSVAFKNAAEESCTRLHELSHATDAKHRLNRDMTGEFGSAKFAEEEIYAELSSSFVGATLNLPTDIPNHANYIHHWLTKLKEEPRFIFKAASTAQKIADWVRFESHLSAIQTFQIVTAIPVNGPRLPVATDWQITTAPKQARRLPPVPWWLIR